MHPANKINLTNEDWDKIKSACEIQCTGAEIASIMGFSYDTLERKIKEKYKKSAAEWIKEQSQGGRASLRRLQWKAANNGNTSMLIWLGKQYLGQSDKVEQDQTIKQKRVNYRRVKTSVTN